jgi:hypothetical protein
MRVSVLGIVLLAVLTALWTTAPCPGPAFAQQTGCCKERRSFRAAWRTNGLSFEICRQLNDRRDRDDVFQPEGFVWWDRRC